MFMLISSPVGETPHEIKPKLLLAVCILSFRAQCPWRFMGIIGRDPSVISPTCSDRAIFLH